VDQRLVNDRTGRGGRGGNTRDTTVARGQMMDIRVFQLVNSMSGTSSLSKDSTLVDVEVRDTLFIIKRPHPNPSLAYVDTGYFVGNDLIVPTLFDYREKWGVPLKPVTLIYNVTR
jgi:hypothetical protein